MLGMEKPVIISKSPNKNNVYLICKKRDRVSCIFAPYLDRLKVERCSMGRVIVFCRRYEDVVALYDYFRNGMENCFTEPVQAPDLPEFRLVDMFTRCTHPDVKSSIITNFSSPKSPLRIVIATIAFAMGLDCPDVRQIVCARNRTSWP